MGGLSDGGARYRHLRAGRASKIGEILIGSENQKMAGTKENIGRFMEILRSSKITLDNFYQFPPYSQPTIDADRDTFSHSSALQEWENVSISRFRPRYDNDISSELTITFSMYFDVIDHAKLLAFFEVVRGGLWFAKKGDFT